MPDGGALTGGRIVTSPMRVESVRPQSPDTWVVGLVSRSERARNVALTSPNIEALTTLEAARAYGRAEGPRIGFCRSVCSVLFLMKNR